MSARQLALVLLKCMGIYLVLRALAAILLSYQDAYGPSSVRSDAEVVQLFSPFWFFARQGFRAAVGALVGCFFIVKASWLVERFFPELPKDETAIVTQLDYQSVGLSVLGAWLVATAIPSVVSQVGTILFLSFQSESGQLSEWLSANWPSVLYVIAQLVVGFVLFRRGRSRPANVVGLA